MSSKRQEIDSLRNKLNERNADSNYSNQFLYNSLVEQGKWLIKREISGGRVYSNPSLFQTLTSVRVEEVSTIDSCSPIKTKCKIYRTSIKLPEMWMDDKGPVVKGVTSIDGSTEFTVISASAWQAKKNDPYQKIGAIKYAFYSEGYIWFPEYNPHLVNIEALFMDDLSLTEDTCSSCGDKECVRFLDTKFIIPDWVEAEMFAKALEQLAGVTKRLPEDQQIDKNSNRKN